MLGCMHALLLTKANTQLVDVHGGTAPQWAEVQGQPTTAELIRLHAAPPQPTFAAPYAPPDAERSPASHAAPPDAGEPAVSSAASLPVEMFQSAQRGELQKVVKWLGKGGLTDALCSTPSVDGRTSTFSLLHAAAGPGQLELVKELLKRGASVDLPTSLGLTALMVAAFSGHLSTLLLLLQYSANLDLQSNSGVTALMKAAHQGQEACVQALLRARANIELLDGNGRTALQHAEAEGHTATVELIRQHAAPLQPAAASLVDPLGAVEPAVSSAASLPIEIFESAEKGELQKVVEWLHEGGLADAHTAVPVDNNQTATATLLHAAAANGHLEMVTELLERGASVDLEDEYSFTALMNAAYLGHLSILHLLLQHSANPDLQSSLGGTALMMAASQGQEACVQALLRAKADTELQDTHGRTALRYSEAGGHTAIVELIRQHAAPSHPAAVGPAAPPEAGEPAEYSPASLPVEILKSAQLGELQKVAKWLRKGGPVDALYPVQGLDGKTAAFALLHAAAMYGHLELVRELLRRGASVDLQSSLGVTALMDAAFQGHLSILLLLLHHSANLDLQDTDGRTALMMAAGSGQAACLQALLRAKANTELLDNNGRIVLRYAEAGGHTAIVELIRQHAAPPQPAAVAPAAPPDADNPAVSSSASLPLEVYESATRGELQKVAKWLRKGGPVDALCSTSSVDGRNTTLTLLHAAAAKGHLEMVRMLLKRGASVNLPSSLGYTALMEAVSYGHASILRFLLHHSASSDLQSNYGGTALMMAAGQGQEACVQVLLRAKANLELQDIDGHTALMLAAAGGQEACVKALLRAKANTELLDKDGRTALWWAEIHSHPAIAELIRQQACLSLGGSVASCDVVPPLTTIVEPIRQHAPRLPGLGVSLCAVFSLAWPWVMLGAMASVAFSRILMARLGQHRAARQQRPHRTARHARAQGRTNTAEPTRQHAAPSHPAAAVVQHTTHAARVARADTAMEELLAEEAAEQAKGQGRSKKSKKKNKAGRAAAAGDESSKAPPAAAPAPLPAAAPKPAASALARAEASLRAAIAGGGLSALEAALAAAPRGVREGSVGTEARAMCDRLLEAQQEAEREAKQEAAAEATRLAAAEEAVRVGARAAAASKAREEAVTAAEAAAAAAAKADALERAMADGGGGGNSGAAGPSEASEAVEVPDDYICPITAEIMTDPVSTLDGFTYERTAITEWLRTKDTSPVTGATLESKTLIPNLSLRSMIRSFA